VSGQLHAPTTLPPGKDPMVPIDWVNPRASLDAMRGENSWLYQDWNSDPSVVQPLASRYTDCSTDQEGVELEMQVLEKVEGKIFQCH
jgi:hypothetical protein